MVMKKVIMEMNNIQVKYFGLFLIFCFYSCGNKSNESISMKNVPNSISVKKYNEASKLVRETICVNRIPKYQMSVKNDTIIEYNLLRIDTIFGTDSLGTFKMENPIYMKKASTNGVVIFEGIGKTEEVSACDCVIGCK